jgi:hypothetical protein
MCMVFQCARAYNQVKSYTIPITSVQPLAYNETHRLLSVSYDLNASRFRTSNSSLAREVPVFALNFV